MSRHGVLQLSKLTVSYCDFSGSSRGAREFVANLLPILQRECPDLEVLQKQQPGRHPLLKGDYRCGNNRVVGVKNTDAEEILRQAVVLRNSAGRRTYLKVKHRHQLPLVRGQDEPCQELVEILESGPFE